MSDEKNKNQDWEFKVNYPDKKNKNLESEISAPVLEKQSSLVLDDTISNRPKTRTAMAKVLEKEKIDDIRNCYSLASIPKRGLAFVLDLVFFYFIFLIVKFSSSSVRGAIGRFVDGHNYKIIISEAIVMKLIMGGLGLIILFFWVVIPVSFFNVSFGKKLLGLRVRGTDKYSISIIQAFMRELVMKPLSFLIIAGFFTPFISKKRLSIHDMLADTIVIDE